MSTTTRSRPNRLKTVVILTAVNALSGGITGFAIAHFSLHRAVRESLTQASFFVAGAVIVSIVAAYVLPWAFGGNRWNG
jgi:hypothetical protein